MSKRSGPPGEFERPRPAGEGGARGRLLQQRDDLPVRAARDPGAGLDVADLVQPRAVRWLRAPALHMVLLGGLLFLSAPLWRVLPSERPRIVIPGERLAV